MIRLVSSAILCGLVWLPIEADVHAQQRYVVTVNALKETGFAKCDTSYGRLRPVDLGIGSKVVDSLEVRFVDDSGKSIGQPTKDSIEVAVNLRPPFLVLPNVAEADTAVGPDSLNHSVITLTRRTSHALVCRVQLEGKSTSGSGTSFVMLSLIKSIAGRAPQSEFFEIRLKFGPRDTIGLPAPRFMRKCASGDANCYSKIPLVFFLTANIDVSLSTETDSLSDTTKHLTDATAAVNVVAQGDDNKIPVRMGYINLVYFKVFNTHSYLGVGYSGLELQGSALEGTSFTLAYLHRLYDDMEVLGADTAGKPVFGPIAQNNMFVEFFLRVPGVDFLDRLRIRGSILLPFGGDRHPEARIVLAVPIVDLQRF